jgi:hypothetical protein
MLPAPSVCTVPALEEMMLPVEVVAVRFMPVPIFSVPVAGAKAIFPEPLTRFRL